MTKGLNWKAMLGSMMTVVFLTACLALAAAAQESRSPEAVIEVEAEGEVLAKPDIAVLTAAVETQAPQVEEARADNARASEALLKAIKSLLKEGEKIQSVSYRIHPIYQHKEKVLAGEKIRTDEVAGYRAVHSFRIELNDLTRIGQVADTALKSGATRLQGPYYEHSQREKLQEQAAVLALSRARGLAEALAQAAGLRVKRLRKVSTAPSYRPFRAALAESKALAATPAPETPIEVGEEKFQARIAATFEVAP